MDTDRRAYAELATPPEMYDDCRSIGVKLRYDRIARAAALPAPSLRFEDFPRDLPKRELSVDAATARLAAALFSD
ncbi:conserved hypothetical protein [metagenome]|uniref:Uncharacterized protein n=1 Tax=metagenome TaxID=256318 RepID=A0A2P2BVZ8_9ZZZZ